MKGAESLRRGAKALFFVVAITAYGLGFVTGCLADRTVHPAPEQRP